ncbi:hypothetical protein [Acetobacter peroxydans]|uniref:Uncharacterized protein n=1 Tax=Acetobacter peroxydans TaxID=104098 RepID=A0A4Y3TZ22_9PROT|nr:hypothetical protein [Acetobacter peroxydans]NHO17128.1 hypothetical protein [Acetobacter peroxydans]GBR38602.1 hypothetical protein AA13755_2241 [Acetobacter peroxydans NBRC 13755]GBR39511.1 hypothetical protein AA0475_0224 [Acetobacter peroxydans]GEB86260.1 hypothetical protein APE01nite_20570 [Acetobacter peroxydans]
MSDLTSSVRTASAPAQEGSGCTGRCCECANRNVTCFMELEDAHYSDQTLAALVKYHGWSHCDPKRPKGGVERLFAGLGADGDLVPNGARYLEANYSNDPESRRYIALHYGFDLLKDWDGREGTPAEIAAQVNKWAEQYVQMERAKLKAA